jgi:hypothetical protein
MWMGALPPNCRSQVWPDSSSGRGSPLDREVRGSNLSHDTMALLLGQNYEFPQCGIIKGKLLLIIIIKILISITFD